MAKTNKIGLDYFPFNVDFFEDDKIQLIQAEFGIKGLIITAKLLCKIYKNGYFYQWGEDECLLFTKNAGAEFVSNAVNEVVNGLVRRRFFDKGCFDTFGILTSSGIQKRYFDATKRYKEVTFIQEYLLINNVQRNNVHIIGINVNINANNDSTFPHNESVNVNVNESGTGSPPDLSESNLFRKPVIPTQQKVEEYFVMNGGNTEMAKKFFIKYSATGWFLNGSPVINWSALASNFISNWKSNNINKQTPVQSPKKIVIK